jgi:hypothetical protein
MTTRIVSLLGAEPKLLTSDHISRIVTSGLAEAFDLDFKSENYPGSDRGKRDLCTDVAALANTAGGVIVIGIEEDEHACASGLRQVPIGDAIKAQMTQIVGNGVSPVPEFNIFLVPGQSESAMGYIVVFVERSLRAPHGVSVNEGWRYPRRNGSTTRYLSEPEVANAYRDRMLGLAERRDLLDAVWTECSATLDLTDSAWVTVTLVPDIPGIAPQDRRAWQRWQAAAQSRHLTTLGRSSVSLYRFRVGQGWFGADGGSPSGNDGLSRYVAWRSYSDGSGFFAATVGGPGGAAYTDPVVLVTDEAVIDAIVTGLHVLGAAARTEAGVSGDLLLRVCLVGCTGPHGVMLGERRRGYFNQFNERPLTIDPRPVDVTASTDSIAEIGPDQIAVAAIPHRGIGQAFGMAELGQVSEDGALRISYFHTDAHPLIRRLAQEASIEVSELLAD